MRWPTWPKSLFLLVLILLGLDGHEWSLNNAGIAVGAQWTDAKKLEAREQTRDLWYHGFNSYMRFAFPLDELAPLSCTGRGPDWHNPANIGTNDVAGNFSLTLIDVLDTFVVLNDTVGFENAVRNVIGWVSFDVNTKPQVFETTIRVLGGLLSAHMFANQTGQPFYLPWYRGELLSMAHELGTRLLPAFSTPTGIPYARINLRHGVLRSETIDTCTAGAGSLILEFGTLSRLTGDDRFEKAAHKAFFALWNRKSDIGLVGNTINTVTGSWLHPEVSGIGAGIDSFYEYALKWYIMSGDVEFLDVWQDAYAAIMRYARAPDGYWYRSVNVHTGDISHATFDSLSAFWPGLQVLAGDVENAIKSHMTFWNIWRGFSGMPEIWDMNYRQATSMQFPLRPEFVESTWYLYRATRDPFYLDVGERILSDISLRAKVDCGLASVKDLRTNQHEDRMESFVLSETLKYLYLLFDEANPLHSDDSNYVLTTEGHLLRLDKEHLKPISAIRRKLRGVEHLQCPAYQFPLAALDDWAAETGLRVGIRSRVDVDYARELIGIKPIDRDMRYWQPDGWCAIPKMDLYSYEFLLARGGQSIPEDFLPSAEKIVAVPDGYYLNDISGIRVRIVSRLDGRGYDLVKLGPYTVKTGQLVYINDTELFLPPAHANGETHHPQGYLPLTVDIRLFLDYVDPLFQQQQFLPTELITDTTVSASTALFGANLAQTSQEGTIRFGHGEGSRVVRDQSNPYGCQPYQDTYQDDVLVVHRGDCTFLEKLLLAQQAGAAGVVVLSDEETHINPSADDEDIAAVGNSIDDVAIVVLRRSEADVVVAMLDSVERMGLGQVMLAVDPVDQSATEGRREATRTTKDDDEYRVLYLNGHALLNTRLLV